MKQSARLILLVLVLWGAHLASAQQDEDGDVVSTDSSDVDEQNGINQSSDSNRIGRIIGGVPTTTANLPYVVMLTPVTNGSGSFYSVGAVISKNQILTSASALLSRGTGILSITMNVGPVPTLSYAKSISSSSYAVHSGFDSATLANDVAIITFANVTSYPNVQPIAIATTEIAVSTANRTKCVVLGYGQNVDGFLTSQVHQADYELMTDQECAATGANPSSILCAQSVSGYACNLDTSGLLVCNNQLYGLLTNQRNCSTSNPPKVQKFAKLPVISIPWNTASTSASNATVPTAPRKNYVSCS